MAQHEQDEETEDGKLLVDNQERVYYNEVRKERRKQAEARNVIPFLMKLPLPPTESRVARRAFILRQRHRPSFLHVLPKKGSNKV